MSHLGSESKGQERQRGEEAIEAEDESPAVANPAPKRAGVSVITESLRSIVTRRVPRLEDVLSKAAVAQPASRLARRRSVLMRIPVWPVAACGWLVMILTAQVPSTLPTEVERSVDQAHREREEQQRLEELLQQKRLRQQQENQRREDECLRRGGYMVDAICRRSLDP